jgi:hypothetical protein
MDGFFGKAEACAGNVGAKQTVPSDRHGNLVPGKQESE